MTVESKGKPGPAGTAGLLKASALGRRTRLTRQALHMYVHLGLLHPVATTRGGHRLFAEEAVQRVELIRKLCATGYTLQDVREIFLKER